MSKNTKTNTPAHLRQYQLRVTSDDICVIHEAIKRFEPLTAHTERIRHATQRTALIVARKKRHLHREQASLWTFGPPVTGTTTYTGPMAWEGGEA